MIFIIRKYCVYEYSRSPERLYGRRPRRQEPGAGQEAHTTADLEAGAT
jgi:hypothetical protein